MKKAFIHPVPYRFDLTCDEISADKSISHRCAMFSLLSDKPSSITNFLEAEDTLNSLKIATMLGAAVEKNGNTITITPPQKITEPSDILDCGNAGTAMRLYCGLLSSIDGAFVLTGDKYLRSRPMKRVVEPLRSIGATIDGRENGNLAPLFIRGGNLEAFDYDSPIDSAQVKSALILAGLHANGVSYYKEQLLSRDHTERMLRGMGADIYTNDDGQIVINPLSGSLKPLHITVPSDPSSGFFFAVAAAITPDSRVRLSNMTLNPTRIEAYKILEKMGAEIQYELKTDVYEPIGDIVV
ncbi:MAG: 3-phosphoshikimate 1-carboxyvinyltransferase, partial [Epsilonproteobacteria bacterium]|nr:3-phosphoshikimate 1-carboxyvinyltransferase [Campylobacterota bacterium]